MYTEKTDIKSLTEYVMRKHKPKQVITTPDNGINPRDNNTHLIYEIGGDSNTRVLTRVGEARQNGNDGDFIMCIYPQYSVSGELVLVKKSQNTRS
ncbi:hypothetical protein [Pantoea sp. BAV 3049]|uniref:hypothetical protein n=1 Tax=Pantoea sp. BAV 3049 TaxID=2654188 RepID=UPI00131C0224|nr:hypothetical protein [Pantoea sp. BAV 3049]